MKLETYDQLTAHPRVVAFVDQLIAAGVPLASIYTNHIEHSPEAVVYVTIPFGNPGGGRSREYRRMSSRDAVRAAAWFTKAVTA